MRTKIIFGAFLVLAGAGLYAQETASSRVVRVTVYADRALVTRRAEVDLPQGETSLIFADLPAAADPASVQVSGSGAFVLRDVRVSTRQRTRDVSERIKELRTKGADTRTSWPL
jgi:hypothetical protein